MFHRRLRSVEVNTCIVPRTRTRFRDWDFRCRWSTAILQFTVFHASYWHWTGWIQTTAGDVLV